jgi:hypothetical protein
MEANNNETVFTKRFIASQVDRICHKRNIKFMRQRLPSMPQVTAEERVAFAEACDFARMWNARESTPNRIFVHGFVSKNCETILALRKRHFPFHSLMACAKGLI